MICLIPLSVKSPHLADILVNTKILIMYNDTIATISTVMTRDLITVSPITLLGEIHEIFKTHTIHHLPVVDDENRLKGVISTVDYAKSLDCFTIFGTKYSIDHNEKIFKSLMAKDIMTKQLVTLSPNDKIGTAVGIFKENLLRSILIVDNEKLVGILTPFDLFIRAYNEPTFLPVSN